MGAVLHYREFTKPAQRWSNMERYHLFKRQGLIPTFDPPGYIDTQDTAPCEYVAPESDSA